MKHQPVHYVEYYKYKWEENPAESIQDLGLDLGLLAGIVIVTQSWDIEVILEHIYISNKYYNR